MPTGEYVRKPTQLQQRCWDALQEHQSVKAAAAALGMTRQAFTPMVETYMRRVGLPGPVPFMKVYRTAGSADREIGELRATIVDLRTELERERDEARAALADAHAAHEQELLRLMKRMADLEEQARPWPAIHAKLDQLLKRPAGPIVPTHRRLSDGGVGGKRERRGQVPAA